jgi:hypothetical protein
MVDQKLVSFVKKCLEQGMSEKDIKIQLEQNGWPYKDIDEALETSRDITTSTTPKISTPKTYCWKCGTENDAIAQNCKHCGVNLAAIPDRKEEVKADLSEQIKEGLIKKEEYERISKAFCFLSLIFGGAIVYIFKIRFFSWTTLIIMLASGILGIVFWEYVSKVAGKAEKINKQKAEGEYIEPVETKNISKQAIIIIILFIMVFGFIFYSCEKITSSESSTTPTDTKSATLNEEKKDFCSSIIPDRINLTSEKYYWKDGTPITGMLGNPLSSSNFHKGEKEGENINYLYLYEPSIGYAYTAFYHITQPISETGEIGEKIIWIVLPILDSNDRTDEGYKVVQYKCCKEGECPWLGVGRAPIRTL